MKIVYGEDAVALAKKRGENVWTHSDALDNGGLMNPDSKTVASKIEADPKLGYTFPMSWEASE